MINKYIESVINFIKNKLDKNIIEAKDIDKALIKQFGDKTNLISIEECGIIEIIGNKPLILNCIEVSIIIKHKDINYDINVTFKRIGNKPKYQYLLYSSHYTYSIKH